VLEKEANLLEEAEESQVVGSKYKEIILEIRRGNGLPRKLEGSNQGNTAEVLQ